MMIVSEIALDQCAFDPDPVDGKLLDGTLVSLQ